MLLCVNELFYQNRYAALTIYLEVNSLSERDVQVATHTPLCVCVRGNAQWRSWVNMDLVGCQAPMVFSALSRDCSSRLQTSISAKAVCFHYLWAAATRGAEE